MAPVIVARLDAFFTPQLTEAFKRL